jgi:AraC-like DNA-binding protein
MTITVPSPTMDDRLYPPYKIAFLAELLQEDGVAPGELLRGSGLVVEALADPATRISYRQLLTVYGNALALSPDPAIALRAGRRIHMVNYGLYGYALVSNPTVRAAFDFGVRYHRLATPTVKLHLWEQGAVAAWVIESAFELDRTSALYRFIIEFQFAINLSLSKDMIGDQARPLEIRAVYPAPSHAARYAEYLDCENCLFSQPANEVRFEARLLDARPSLANPITAAMLRETCDRLVSEMQTATGVASKVHALLLRNPGQFPDEEAVAVKLHMVSRTLRRKLAAEGTSYTQILSDARRQLALKYLRETRVSIEDIAASLGFSDASSFRQAFKRWTEKNPSDFRAT